MMNEEVGPIKTHRKLHDFKKQRKDANDISKFKLYEDVHDVRRLHKHVDEFKKALKEDLKSQDLKVLKMHAEEFEAEIHDEVTRMLSVTRKDLDHYLKTLHSLAEFKKVMKELEREDPRFKAIVETELKYAKVIHEGLHQKLSTLERMFKRMSAR